jgi:hypothetical protein
MSLDTERAGFAATAKSLLGRGGLMAPAPHRGTRIATFEGPRGYSTRAAVYARHAAYLLTIVLCSSLTHIAMQAAGPFSIDGGSVMLFMSALTLLVGALGTAAYPAQRNQIIEQVRHYVFGLMVLPGTGVAAILWIVKVGLISQQANPDAFSRTVDLGLLMLFGTLMIMPPVVFLKLMSGIRTLARSTRDDQEMMSVWARQDGYQH